MQSPCPDVKGCVILNNLLTVFTLLYQKKVLIETNKRLDSTVGSLSFPSYCHKYHDSDCE